MLFFSYWNKWTPSLLAVSYGLVHILSKLICLGASSNHYLRASFIWWSLPTPSNLTPFELRFHSSCKQLFGKQMNCFVIYEVVHIPQLLASFSSSFVNAWRLLLQRCLHSCFHKVPIVTMSKLDLKKYRCLRKLRRRDLPLFPTFKSLANFWPNNSYVTPWVGKVSISSDHILFYWNGEH